VATRRWILYLLPAATIAVLAGCGSNSTFNVQNPPPPPAQTLSIEFTPASTGVVQVPINSTANFTATVTNDPSNEGVEWALLPTTCQTNAAPCGTLSAQYTPSGTSVTYTPPSSISGNNLNVIVAAYAKADQTHNALAQVDVTAFGSNLSGTYVLEAQGADSSFYPYQFAGLIFLDGNGNITAGQQTVNFFDNTPTVGAQVSDTNTITGGSYFLGPDGRGTITINTTNSDIGPESFSFVFLSSSQALIAALPTSSLAISGTGTMDLQDPKYQATPHPTPPPGGYAFMTNGTTGGVPQAFGGILDIDSSNNVVESDSVMDQYVAINGMGSAPVWNNARPTGSVSNTSTFGGVITLALNVPAFSNSNPTPTFTGYIVDDNHIKLIENDGASSTVGLAIAQGSDAGTFSDASFSGTYAFGVTGADLDNVNSPPAATTLASAGVFSVDGAGDLNGFTDTLLQSNTFAGVNGNCTVNGAAPNGAQISTTFDGATYSVDNAGLGRFAVSLESFSPQPVCKGYASHFLFYLTGNDTAALVLEVGSANYPFLGTGIAYLQSTSPTFPDPTPNNMYGFSFTQQNGSEYDGTALMTANPTATPPSLSGTVDNNIGVGQSFTGTFTLPPGCSVSPSSSGCFAGTFSNVNNNAFVGVPPSGDTYAFTADFFVIDADHGFFVETDLLTQQTPQVSFGYYACRDSVTGQPTCPTAQQSDKRSTVLHR
jgi:hypothetical protein